ncbi:MAG: hypothetical protein CL840_16070 [Crocinitomicaceae bacterium]|nr:hypothetical protein [Crocinitomicaceae bacterium]|tara:strand:+ start:2092 stop:4185 length:2094 start_codon:yes stop_codon:yes gene_type:complete
MVQYPKFSNLKTSTRFKVHVTASSGCTKEAHVNVTVSDPFPGSMTLMTSDTLICLKDTIDVWIDGVKGYDKLLFTWAKPSNSGLINPRNVDSLKAIANLTTSKQIQVLVEDSAYGICQANLSITINTVSKYDVKPKGKGPYCESDGIIVFQSNTPQNITSPGGKWSGIGSIDSIKGYWDSRKTGVGSFWVYNEVTGNACANKDSLLFGITKKADANFSGPDSICLYALPDNNLHKLMPSVSGGSFSGLGLDSVQTSTGGYTYFVNPSLFSTGPGKTDSAVITYKIGVGCENQEPKFFRIIGPWNSTYTGVEYNSQVYATDSFCVNSPTTELLRVAGHNPSWTCLTEKSAILDSTTGEFLPKIAYQNGANTQVQIRVNNSGFCGSSDTIELHLIAVPEIEILPEKYCDYGLSDSGSFTKVDTLFFRIPKGPLLSGSTGTRKLDTNGFNPNTEALAYYGDQAQTGWPRSCDTASDRYKYNSWGGKPWMVVPNVPYFRIISLPRGANRITYKYSVDYRSGHPEHICTTMDTAFVIRDSALNLTLLDMYNICYHSPAKLDAGKFYNAKYTWSTGDTSQFILSGTNGVYTVTVSTEYCKNTKSTIVVTKCLQVEEQLDKNVKIKLYPNPTSSMITLKLTGNNDDKAELKIYDLKGQEVSYSRFESHELNDGIEIDVTNLSPGAYLFMVSSGSNFSTYRVIIE